MRESDPNRYERIPGSARRYLDLETGESISRREYDNRTKGEAPEWGGNERDGYDGDGYDGDGYDGDDYDGDDDYDYYIDIVSAGGSTRD
jgi:hypothetical protein